MFLSLPCCADRGLLLFIICDSEQFPLALVKKWRAVCITRKVKKHDFKPLESFHKNNVHRAEDSFLAEHYNVLTTVGVILPSAYPPFKSSSYSTVCICEEPEMMESWYRTGAPVYSSSHPHHLHAGKMWIFIMSQCRNLHVWYEVSTWSATDPESTLVPALTTASPHTTKRCFLPQFVTYLPLPSKPSSRIHDFTGKYVFKYQQHSIS